MTGHPYRSPPKSESEESLDVMPGRWRRVAHWALWPLCALVLLGSVVIAAIPGESVEPLRRLPPLPTGELVTLSPPAGSLFAARAASSSATVSHTTIAVSSGGELVAWASDSTFSLWDASGQLLRTFAPEGWNGPISRLQLAPASDLVLVEIDGVSASGKQVWTVEWASSRLSLLEDPCGSQPAARVTSALFLHDGRLASWSRHGLCMSNARSGEPASYVPTIGNEECSLSAMPAHDRVAVVCPAYVAIWDLPRAQIVARHLAPPGEQIVQAVAAPHDDAAGRWVMLTRLPTGLYRVWSITGNQRASEPLFDGREGPVELSFGSSWKHLVVSGRGLCSWDIVSGTRRHCLVDEGSLVAAAIDHAGSVLVATEPSAHAFTAPQLRRWPEWLVAQHMGGH